MVADDQQRPPGAHGRGEGGEKSCARFCRKLHELGRDQVEGVGRGRRRQQIGPTELDARRRHRIDVAGVARRSFEGDARDVDCDHVPPASREPDGVGTFATANVESATRDQTFDLDDQLRVRVPAPDMGR